MKITTKELRIQPGKILDQVSTMQEITVTYRGKPLAKIIPFDSLFNDDENDAMFGMWKKHSNKSSVEEQVRKMRKGRKF